MRTIKFRGKDIETSEWVYGDLIQRIGYMPSIMFPYESNGKIKFAETAVKRETIGQFTGLTDKNGVEIYEGDILHFSDGSQHVVMWDEYECGFNIVEYGIYLCEVIGNIHDNPELLKGE